MTMRRSILAFKATGERAQGSTELLNCTNVESFIEHVQSPVNSAKKSSESGESGDSRNKFFSAADSLNFQDSLDSLDSPDLQCLFYVSCVACRTRLKAISNLQSSGRPFDRDAFARAREKAS